MSNKPTLTENDYMDAATQLNCEVAAIKAVTDVEAPRGGFIEDGRVRILFERHKFYKYTGGKASPFKQYTDICNPVPGGYGAEGAHQYNRFSQAFKLDPSAAMKSASWGKFQIMGFNYADAGFHSVDDFVTAMKISEGEQLKAFVTLIKRWNLADELRNHRWATFALHYNGQDYEKNRYDVKLAAAYKKHSSGHSVVSTRPSGPIAVGSSIADDLEDVSEGPNSGEPAENNQDSSVATPSVADETGTYSTGVTPAPQVASQSNTDNQPSVQVEHADEVVAAASTTPVPGGGFSDAIKTINTKIPDVINKGTDKILESGIGTSGKTSILGFIAMVLTGLWKMLSSPIGLVFVGIGVGMLVFWLWTRYSTNKHAIEQETKRQQMAADLAKAQMQVALSNQQVLADPQKQNIVVTLSNDDTVDHIDAPTSGRPKLLRPQI
jgi:hypothetical protein